MPNITSLVHTRTLMENDKWKRRKFYFYTFTHLCDKTQNNFIILCYDWANAIYFGLDLISVFCALTFGFCSYRLRNAYCFRVMLREIGSLHLTFYNKINYKMNWIEFRRICVQFFFRVFVSFFNRIEYVFLSSGNDSLSSLRFFLLFFQFLFSIYEREIAVISNQTK